MINSFIHKRRLEIGICLFLILVCLVIYVQVSGFSFVSYDDELYITKNPYIKAGFTRDSIVWAFTSGYAANWHPLTWLSHMLDIELYGLNPMGHHWTNLQIHIINVVLLFLFLKWMTGTIWRSAFVSVLFAVHPLHVESVAWISERKDVLCAFFWILSMWGYVGYVRRPKKTRYLLLIILFTLGLLSKPMIVSLPFALLLLDFWPLERFQSLIYERKFKPVHAATTLIFEKMPLFMLSAVSGIVTFFVQQHAGAVASIASLPIKARIAEAIVSYAGYILKMIWPLHLAILYPVRQWPLEQVLMAGTMILLVSILAILKWRKHPYLAMGWFWYLGTLIPVIGLVHVGPQIMADRYTYIPSIGLFIAVSWGIADYSAKWSHQRIVLSISASASLIFLMTCSWFQAGYWRNGIQLYTHATKITYNNAMAYCGLGRAYERRGKYNEAVKNYLKALQINPDYAEPYYELGVALEAQGHSEAALKNYENALRIKPDYASVHNNIGVIMNNRGKFKEAVYHYRSALKIDPNYAIAHYNLGDVFFKHGKVEEALRQYQKALKSSPNMPQALYIVSSIRASNENEKYRNGEEAIKLAERLCKITNYTQPLAMDVLAAAYAETGRFDAAVSTAQKGLALAVHQGAKDLILGLEMRLQLYKTRHPYRQRLSN